MFEDVLIQQKKREITEFDKKIRDINLELASVYLDKAEQAQDNTEKQQLYYEAMVRFNLAGQFKQGEQAKELMLSLAFSK